MLTPELFVDQSFLTMARKHYDLIIIEESHDTIPFPAKVLHHLREGISLLAICIHTPATLLFPLASFAQKKFTLVDSFPGILAFSEKGSRQHTDLLSAHGYGFTILETNILEDFSRFFVRHDTLSYIRTTPHLVSEENLPQATYLDNEDLVLGFQAHGFAGSSYTLLGTITMGVELMTAHRLLQDYHHSGDIFLVKTPFPQFSKEIHESIKRTGRLIIVMDTLPTPLFLSRFHAQLLLTHLVDIKVSLVTPDYDNITSIAPEYLFEQGRFDGMNIAERIRNILE